MPETPKSLLTKRAVLSLALELGFIIALPIVLLGLAGKWADARFDTEPWLTITGLLLAIAATTVWLSRRFAKIFRAMKKDDDHSPQPKP